MQVQYEIFTTGEYGYGQLFNHAPRYNKEFELNKGLNKILETKRFISMIDSGEDYTVFVTHDNQLYVCGLNNNNIFDIPKPNLNYNYTPSMEESKTILKEPHLIPAKLYNKEEITHISCGASHFIIVTNHQNIYTFGLILNGNSYFKKLRTENFGVHYNKLLQKSGNSNKITFIASGDDFTVIVVDFNYIYVIVKGDNTNQYYYYYNYHNKFRFRNFTQHIFKDLSITKDEKKKIYIKQLACGRYHFVLLTEDNQLYGMGSNDVCQLGISSAVAQEYSKDFHKLQLPTAIEGKEIKQLVCGFKFTMIVSGFNIYACGDNQYGQFGMSSPRRLEVLTEIKYIPDEFKVSCGGNHTIIHLTKTNELLCAGFNGSGEIGLGVHGTTVKQFTLCNRKFDRKITHVLCGRSVSIVVTQTGIEALRFQQKLFHTAAIYEKLVDIDIHTKSECYY
ncbi:hypothetical protein ABK040_014754 [Willaertia magna]